MNRRKFITAAGAATALVSIPSIISHAATSSQIEPSVIKALKDRIKPITNEERQQRQEKARRLMAENKIDAILMEGGTTMSYFTGAQWGRSERLFAMLLPQKGEPFYIAPAFEEGRAMEQTGNAKIYTWQENENPYELLRKALTDANLSTGVIGIEETTRYFVTDNLQKTIAGIRMTSATPVTAGCRSIKSAHEVELMQVANDLTAEVYKEAFSRLKEGMGERELAGIFSNLFVQCGGTNPWALVLFGAAAAYPHGTVFENKLKEGDVVLVDSGCAVEGYGSDITRTTVFGKPTEKMKSVFSIVRKAQDAGLKAAKPGIEAQQVDAAARKVIEQSDYGNGYKYFTHRLGHGIGMDGHEWNYLVGGSTIPLQPGNMFSNEPGIYIVGEFGIRLEDEMLITENGAKLLLPQAQSFETMF